MSRRCYRAALGVAALLALAVPGAADAFTISSTPASPPVASGFVGVSTEYCSLGQYLTSPRHPAGPVDPEAAATFARLITNLSPRPFVRIGGGSTEGIDAVTGSARIPRFHDCPFNSGFPLTGGITEAIKALQQRSGARLILGITLQGRAPAGAGTVCERLAGARPAREQLAVAELRALRRLRPYAFELGNEPLLCPQLLADLARWRGLVTRYGGGAGVAGPSLSESPFPWGRRRFREFLDAAEPAGHGLHELVTFHEYPLVGGIFDGYGGAGCLPGGAHGYLHDRPSQRPTVANLLSQSAVSGITADVGRWVAPAGGRAVRVDEMNSASHEGCADIGEWRPRTNVSNTFASALWALDSMFALARRGVSGVNIHTIPGAPYELFSHVRCSGGSSHRSCWLIHPEYYGLLAFAAAAPAGSRLLSVGGSAPGVHVWAVRPRAGGIHVVVINESGHSAQVTLRGLPSSGLGLYRLLASSPTSTAGVSLGGRTFGPARAGVVDTRAVEGDRTSTGELGAPIAPPVVASGSAPVVAVPAYSAAVVSSS